MRPDPIAAGRKGGDPATPPAGAMRDEKVWELLLTRSYDERPTCQQLFDDLSPGSVEELVGLYHALPAGAQGREVPAPVWAPVGSLTDR